MSLKYIQEVRRQAFFMVFFLSILSAGKIFSQENIPPNVSQNAPANDINNGEISYEEELKYNEGLDLYQEKRYRYAIVIFEEFLQLYPASLKKNLIIDMLVEMHQKLQQYPQAAEALRLKIKLNGDSESGLQARFELGKLCILTAKPKEARFLFEQIIAVNPQSAYAEKAAIELRLMAILPEKE